MKALTMKLLVQFLLGKFLSVIWNLVTKTLKTRKTTFIFQNFNFFLKRKTKLNKVI